MTVHVGIHSLPSHDGSVAAFDSEAGLLLALEEERITRDKHSVGRTPLHATSTVAATLKADLGREDVAIARPWLQGSSADAAVEAPDVVLTRAPLDVEEILLR